MTPGSNLAFELADRRAEQEREAGVARIQAALRGRSDVYVCVDCDTPIPAARKAANPNATRCIDCETFIERQNRRCA